jgi:hypothetical protein
MAPLETGRKTLRPDPLAFLQFLFFIPWPSSTFPLDLICKRGQATNENGPANPRALDQHLNVPIGSRPAVVKPQPTGIFSVPIG